MTKAFIIFKDSTWENENENESSPLLFLHSSRVCVCVCVCVCEKWLWIELNPEKKVSVLEVWLGVAAWKETARLHVAVSPYDNNSLEQAAKSRAFCMAYFVLVSKRINRLTRKKKKACVVDACVYESSVSLTFCMRIPPHCWPVWKPQRKVEAKSKIERCTRTDTHTRWRGREGEKKTRKGLWQLLSPSLLF